jgi:hypothetical protein
MERAAMDHEVAEREKRFANGWVFGIEEFELYVQRFGQLPAHRSWTAPGWMERLGRTVFG